MSYPEDFSDFVVSIVRESFTSKGILFYAVKVKVPYTSEA